MTAAYSNPLESKSQKSHASVPCRNPVPSQARQTLDLMRESLQPLTVAGRDGELTFAEIGEQLGISKARARELYLKGMNKLRGELVRV